MISRRSIGSAILEGVQEANKQYEKWSRGLWVTDSGIEGHVVSTIAEKLHGLIAGKGSIEMEMPFGAIQEWSGAGRPRGRPRFTMNPRNRADIAILTKKWRPVCVIEVKRFWEEKKCLEDLERVRDLILRCGNQRNGSLKAGFLAFLLDGWEEEDMNAEECLYYRRKEIAHVLRDRFDKNGVKMKPRMGPTRCYPRRYRKLLKQPKWVHAPICISLWSG